ncbi:PIG-L family deacetylase [Roseospira goensis]|uniref:LmbE family N-acetylglucosaminyl deacetylase/GT2 family glycosyltransferase n=1 Tax=Roseospira goensis TaxID=391922 RepID=A0A7W6WMJ2_9PROT|nr:PIG-L family deacetylase [Roseospira goensis]MBB4287818.1 LmbE family N-acetylglucosaminyl deacetylase/GT2 family glycosyltransferase [Roseospira goensis]
MEHFFVPTRATVPTAARVLVLAPHPDDEVFGCGGTVARMAAAGSTIEVVVLSRPADDTMAETRRAESARAAAILGYPAPEGWTYQDGTLVGAIDLADRLADVLRARRPDLVFAPSPWEMHRDHRAVCEAVVTAFRDAEYRGRLAFYEVGQPLQPDTLVDITPVLEAKRAAMQVFESQLAVQDYARHIEALNAYRSYTLPRETRAAEAFLVLAGHEVPGALSRCPPDRVSAAVWSAERAVARCQADVDRLGAELAAVRGSTSWRVTRPLRAASAAAGRARVRLARLSAGSVGAIGAGWSRRLAALEADLEDSAPARRPAIGGTPDAGAGAAPRPDWVTVSQTRDGVRARVRVVVLVSPEAGLSAAMADALSALDYPRDRLDLVVVSPSETGAGADALVARLSAGGWAASVVAVPPKARDRARALNRILTGDPDAAFVLMLAGDAVPAPDTLSRLVAIATADAPDVASWEARTVPGERRLHYDPVSWETAASEHACTLLRVAAVRAVGGYDPAVSSAGAAMDLSLRLRRAGHRLRYCPVATVARPVSGDQGPGDEGPGDEGPGEDDPGGDGGRDADRAAWAVPSLRAASDAALMRLRCGSPHDGLLGLVLLRQAVLAAWGAGQRRACVAHLARLAGPLLRAAVGARARARRTPDPARPPVRFFGLDVDLRRRDRARCTVPPDPAETAPLVSVITRTHGDRGWLLGQAGLSVLQQTYPALEWIVVEDTGAAASGDGPSGIRRVVDALARHSGRPVRYETTPRRGRSAAGNHGLAVARGRWCLFLDDDDLLYADHVETLAARLRAEPSLVAAYGLAWTVACDIDGAAARIDETAWFVDPWQIQAYDEAALHHQNFMPIQSVLFERRLFEARGGFDESLDLLEDWDLWRRYAAGHAFGFVDKVTSLFRRPADSVRLAVRQTALLGAYDDVKRRTDAAVAQMAGP